MAATLNKGVYIIAGKRTPFGKMNGVLRETRPEDLFATAAKAAFKASGVAPPLIDTVNIGQVSSLSENGMSTRHAALKAGVPQEKPVLSTNMLSGSALSAMIISAKEILTGFAHMALAGGMECLTTLPFLIRNVRFGIPLGSKLDFEDMLHRSNYDSYRNMSFIQTADKLADMYKIAKREADEYALRSQKRWKAAHDQGIFDTELAPVTVKLKSKEVVMTTDEVPRPDITIEDLSKMRPLYNGGVCTIGNACGVNDGAGAVILASEQALKQHSLEPLARIVGWSMVGVEPGVMGIGPVPATRSLLAAAGLTLSDIDLIELHETFAAQALACIQELKIDQNKMNLNGGALSIGHPSGASGARLTSHLMHELRRRQLKRGLVAIAVGGGQGVAVLIENV